MLPDCVLKALNVVMSSNKNASVPGFSRIEGNRYKGTPCRGEMQARRQTRNEQDKSSGNTLMDGMYGMYGRYGMESGTPLTPLRTRRRNRTQL
jgi:hypothetical protein